MIQIPDAPWIRDAERNGYPCGDDDEDDDFPFEVPCCSDCGALRYEHEAGIYSASCTDSKQTLRGEERRVLIAARQDVRGVSILRPAWCNKEECK